jgi:hypothetical protein
MPLERRPSKRANCAVNVSGLSALTFIFSMYRVSFSLQFLPSTPQSTVLPALSTYSTIMFSSPSSSHIDLSVRFKYDAPSTPDSWLKYRIVGQPPAPIESRAIHQRVWGNCEGHTRRLTLSRSNISGQFVPGLCGSPRIDTADRLMSAKDTSLFPSNAFETKFHEGACFCHQPHPAYDTTIKNVSSSKKRGRHRCG